MTTLHWRLTKQNFVLLLLLGLACSRALAGGIEGIAGYALGATLDKQTVLKETRGDDGATVYDVKPLKTDQPLDRLTVLVTPGQQIHRISAFSPATTATACEKRMATMQMQIEKQSPELKYYAMHESEMFYQGDRTYTLECIKANDGVRLRQEYSDDKLAEQVK